MTPDKDRLLAQTMDWVRSQIREPDSRAATDLDRADAALMGRMAGSSDGRAMLELIARVTVLRPALDPRLSGAASHDYAQRRTGENGVFAALVHLIDLHDLLKKENAHDRSDRPEPVFGWTDAPGLSTGGGSRWSEPDAGDAVFGGLRFDEAGTVAVS